MRPSGAIMNLFKINEDLQAAIELAEQEEELSREDGQWLFKIIEGLNIDRDAKLENIGRFYKNESALADMIDAEIKALQARNKTHQNKAKWLKEWAKANMQPGEKLEFSACSYAWRSSESVEVLNLEKLPDQFKKVEVSAMKKEIGAAIKAGVKFESDVVRVNKNNNLQIK
jgi:Siphovirus Gp157